MSFACTFCLLWSQFRSAPGRLISQNHLKAWLDALPDLAHGPQNSGLVKYCYSTGEYRSISCSIDRENLDIYFWIICKLESIYTCKLQVVQLFTLVTALKIRVCCNQWKIITFWQNTFPIVIELYHNYCWKVRKFMLKCHIA